MGKFTNSEKLKIFISSAQNIENGLSWHEIRLRIKEHLKKEKILDPFIMEDVCSTIPSAQLYQVQVLNSDIVVLLVKGDVREGTRTEFALCAKHKIPLLVYFISDPSPSSNVEKIKETIQEDDLCTYNSVSDLDGIEKRIKRDIFDDIVRYFKGYRVWDSIIAPTSDDATMSIEKVYSSYGIPGKTSLTLFQSCYSYFNELLNIPVLPGEDDTTNTSEFHELGKELINWLIKGDLINSENSILSLVENTKNIYQNTEWLKHRWDAIRFELIGESNRALESEQKALDIATNAGFPQWIINNILVDCRNIEAEIEYINRRFPMSHSAQEKLNSLETIVYLPTVDRYLNQIYSEINCEEFEVTTSSHKTMRFSNRLGYALKDLANYFFSSVLYGSYTHMSNSRNILSYVLEKFSQFHNSSKLLFESIKLDILNGGAKDFLSMINAKWDELYLNVTTCADDLWELSQKAIVSDRNHMELAVLKVVGLYLSDEIFIDAEKYLFDFSNNVYWGNSEDYFKCILSNIMRLNQDKLVRILCEIISDHRFHLGGTLSKIIFNIEFKNVSQETLNTLNDVLMDHLPYIVSNNGNPQLVSVLVCHDPKIFSDLEALPQNGLDGIERKLYEINVGLSNWNEMLDDEIESARDQFEHCKATGEYIGYASSSYDLISRIVRKSDNLQDNKIVQTLQERFIPLAIEILNSNVNVLIKDECIECLCDVLSFLLCQNINIPSDVVKAIQNIEANKTGIRVFIKSEDTFPIKVLMSKIIVGMADKNDLFSCCIGYNQKTIEDRLALATCLEKYLYHYATKTNDIDVLLIALIAQCCDDDYYEIKSIGCKCVSYILSSGFSGDFRDVLEKKLIQHAMDSSDFVRSSILILCKSKAIIGDLYSRLIEIFKNDANYTIRYGAQTID